MSESSKASDSLLPCPFCGGEATLYGPRFWSAYCSNDDCPVHPLVSEGTAWDGVTPAASDDFREIVAAAWNARADATGRPGAVLMGAYALSGIVLGAVFHNEIFYSVAWALMKLGL